MKTQHTGLTSYLTPAPTTTVPKRLVAEGELDGGESFTFYDRIELGRFTENLEKTGLLRINDPTVSSRHCIITQEPDGRCFVRDISRNGTRLEGRRLSPNLKTEFQVGQVLSVGRQLSLRLEGETPTATVAGLQAPPGTLAVSYAATVTVLVGDIRDYTLLVQKAASAALQDSVGRVFERLEHEVLKLGGTLKEFQGDALFAFWEKGSTDHHAADACHAALALHALSVELATDPEIWQVENFPLEMDWALTTGPVVMAGHGDGNALGLSMVGEPVVLAFRIEKFANEETGPIIVCPETRKMASKSFKFRKLGSRQAKGFDTPQKLFALVKETK